MSLMSNLKEKAIAIFRWPLRRRYQEIPPPTLHIHYEENNIQPSFMPARRPSLIEQLYGQPRSNLERFWAIIHKEIMKFPVKATGIIHSAAFSMFPPVLKEEHRTSVISKIITFGADFLPASAPVPGVFSFLIGSGLVTVSFWLALAIGMSGTITLGLITAILNAHERLVAEKNRELQFRLYSGGSVTTELSAVRNLGDLQYSMSILSNLLREIRERNLIVNFPEDEFFAEDLTHMKDIMDDRCKEIIENYQQLLAAVAELSLAVRNTVAAPAEEVIEELESNSEHVIDIPVPTNPEEVQIPTKKDNWYKVFFLSYLRDIAGMAGVTAAYWGMSLTLSSLYYGEKTDWTSEKAIWMLVGLVGGSTLLTVLWQKYSAKKEEETARDLQKIKIELDVIRTIENNTLKANIYVMKLIELIQSMKIRELEEEHNINQQHQM